MITATKATTVNSKLALLSYLLGFWATGLALTQMVSFEDFVVALQDYGVTSGGGAIILGVVLLALEIGSVPFLLRLSLSPLARMLSAVSVVLLPVAWTLLTVAALLGNAHVPNAAYFGHFFELQVSVIILTLDVVWLAVIGWSFNALGGQKALKPKL